MHGMNGASSTPVRWLLTSSWKARAVAFAGLQAVSQHRASFFIVGEPLGQVLQVLLEHFRRAGVIGTIAA